MKILHEGSVTTKITGQFNSRLYLIPGNLLKTLSMRPHSAHTEFKRKLFHSLAALYACIATVLSRSQSLELFGCFTVLELLFEFTRLKNHSLNQQLLRLFDGVYRKAEVSQLSGIFWSLAGVTAAITLVPDYRLAIMGIWYLAVGDGLAGFIGRTWGRHQIGAGPKTWEGTLSCFAGCWIVGVLLLKGKIWWLPLIGATVTSLIEWLPLPLNDNFWLPPISAGVLYLFSLLTR